MKRNVRLLDSQTMKELANMLSQTVPDGGGPPGSSAKKKAAAPVDKQTVISVLQSEMD